MTARFPRTRGDSRMRTALVFYSLKRAKCAYVNMCEHVPACMCVCTDINAFNVKVDLNASLSILTSGSAKVKVAHLG